MYTIDNLPDAVKALPKHAQEIWMAAYNSAFQQYKEDEGKCNATAWSAVETQYKKGDDGDWHMKAAGEEAIIPGFSRIISAAGDGEEKGWKWRVQIIESGIDKQGTVDYPLAVLYAARDLYEGSRVFALTEGQHSAGRHPFGKSVRDLVGMLTGVAKNSTGLEGTLTILRSAAWLRDMLLSMQKEEKMDLIGLSHDVLGKVSMRGGVRVAEKIMKVDSVDVVYEPIGGGKFLRMAAAAQAQGQKEDDMLRKLLAALKGQRPDLRAQIDAIEAKGDTATEEEMMTVLTAAMATKQDDGQKDEIKEYLTKLTASITDVTTGQAKELVAQATKKFEDTQKLMACATTLADELANCGLPDIMKARVRRQFEGQIFEAEKLTAAIKEEKEIADKLTGSGIPMGAGGLRAEVTQGEPERLQAALDKLLGADVDEKYKDVPAFTSLRGAYVRLTGDPDLRGVPSREGMKLGEAFMNMMRLPAAYSSSSFSFVLGNSMYRRLLKEYLAVDYREDILISFYRNAENFKTLEIIQVGYFGDIPDINPETGDYQEITMPTDIEATYAINQKGVILTVTRRVMLNDDLKTVVQLVSKLGRSQRRTHAKRAWAKIISNATFKGDTTALFHNDHANLGATGLTADATGVSTLTARLKAMYAQTEQDSGEGLALVPQYLWCPRDIRETAETLNSPWPGATAPNPHAGRFGANHERIITNPLFIDPNDWGLIASASDVELLEAAYINGRREPEFFVADNPVVGQMFIADKIQYKTRHEYEFEIADYRGFDKAVVT